MSPAQTPTFRVPACTRPRRLIRTLCAVALPVAVSALSPGCGAPKNLAQAADVLQAGLTSMPGVSDAWVYHDETYAEGVVFNIAVDVSTATREEIIDVADRIRATRIGLIANYSQNVGFWVTQDRAVTVQRHGQLDAAQIADDSARLREIAAATDGRITWFRSDDGAVNRLSFDKTRSSGVNILDAVRNTMGDSAVSVSVSPVSVSRQTPRMVVAFPLDATEQASVFTFLGAIPADVVEMRIDSGAVRALEVVTPDPTTAEQDLSAVVTASAGVSPGPVWLAWYFPTFPGGAPAFGGVVHVTGCSRQPVPEVERVSKSSQDDGLSSLQLRLQTKIDTCPAPQPVSAPPVEAQLSEPVVEVNWNPSPAPSRPPAPVASVNDVVSPDRKQVVSYSISPSVRPHAVRASCPTSTSPRGYMVTSCSPTNYGSPGNATPASTTPGNVSPSAFPLLTAIVDAVISPLAPTQPTPGRDTSPVKIGVAG